MKKFKGVEILGNFVDQSNREDNRGDGKRTSVGREAKFGKKRSGAAERDKKRGKQMRGEIREEMIDCIPGEEMARLQRSH